MKLKRAVSLALCFALVCQPLSAAAAQDYDYFNYAPPTASKKPIEGVEGLYYSSDSNGLEALVDKNSRILTSGRYIDLLSAEDRVFELGVPIGIGDVYPSIIRIDENDELVWIVSAGMQRVCYSDLNGAKFASRSADGSSPLFDGTHYDLDGNEIEDIEAYLAPYDVNLDIDDWAKDTVSDVYEFNEWLPDWLVYNPRSKITRSEFCTLVVEMLKDRQANGIRFAYPEYDLENSDRKQLPVIADSYTSPFTDVDNYYISAAYNLGIVSGRGDGRFAPYDYITRQEAAVMLVNAARVMGIDDYDSAKEVSFVDESYFADWAEDAIDRICRIKNKDGEYIMTGTGEGKFSPWWSYSREQAVVTLDRLYRTLSSIDNEFRVPVRADYKAIGESYSLGGFENSLFTKASLDSYFEKWLSLAKTPEEKAYVQSLSDVCNTTARYYALFDALSAEGVDEQIIRNGIDKWEEIFEYGLSRMDLAEGNVAYYSNNPVATLNDNGAIYDRAIEIWNDLYNENKINLTYDEKAEGFTFASKLPKN